MKRWVPPPPPVRPGRCSNTCWSNSSSREAAIAKRCSPHSPTQRASQLTTPMPFTRTIQTDTTASTRPWSTPAQPSRSMPVSGTPRRRRRLSDSSAPATTRMFRSKRSCLATTCRVALPSARSRQRASGSTPSTWESRNSQCIQLASCAAPKTPALSPLRSPASSLGA